MKFNRSIELIFSEVEQRKNAREKLCKFGIDYLDDAAEGIMSDDLVLIGAGSGAGKTQLCTNMAAANIANGKRVHYIALEAAHSEIERRLKYQLFAKNYFEDPDRPRDFHLTYKRWRLGDFINPLEKYEAHAISESVKMCSNLYTLYKTDDFTVNTLVDTVLGCADETDLIIVDHVHYFDYEEKNENRAIAEIAKTARQLALEQDKPIVLVSHLRKADKSQDREMCPGLEEFHGSSDLYKIATMAVTIAAGGWNPQNNKSETYFRIVKDRNDGSLLRYMGVTNYLPKEGRYEEGYGIGKFNQKRTDGFTELDQTLWPEWAKRARSWNSFSIVPGRPPNKAPKPGPTTLENAKKYNERFRD